MPAQSFSKARTWTRCLTIRTNCRMSSRRWPVLRPDPTADRFISTDSRAERCRPSRPSARSASTRILSRQSSTTSATGESRSSPSREPTSCMAADSCRATTAPSTPATRSRRRPRTTAFSTTGRSADRINKKASFFLSVEGRNSPDATSTPSPMPPQFSDGTLFTIRTPLTGGLLQPANRVEVSPRIDLQLGQKNTLTVALPVRDRQFQRKHRIPHRCPRRPPPHSTQNTPFNSAIRRSSTITLSTRLAFNTGARQRSSTRRERRRRSVNVAGYFTGGGNGNQYRLDHTVTWNCRT